MSIIGEFVEFESGLPGEIEPDLNLFSGIVIDKYRGFIKYYNPPIPVDFYIIQRKDGTLVHVEAMKIKRMLRM